MTRALEPYLIDYKESKPPCNEGRPTRIAWCFYIFFFLFAVIWIKFTLFGLLGGSAQFAGEYPYTIQCGEI